MFMFVPRAIGRHRRNLFALAPDYLRKKETTEPTSRACYIPAMGRK